MRGGWRARRDRAIVGLAVGLGACAPDPEPRPATASTGLPTETTLPAPAPAPAPVPTPPAPPVSESTVAGWTGGDPSALLFDDARIHQVDIVLPEASVTALEVDPFTYAVGDVVVDGAPVGQVGVRLRGKIGSFRVLSDKPKFKVDFNQFVAGQELFGVETLTLNNSVGDCSYLREKLGFRVYAEAGVAVPRLTWTQVTVNGADYGLYQLVETEDDVWLDHAWADGSGNLYDGKYVWYGGWYYTLLDFTSDVHDLYALEEGVDVGRADVHAITAALDLWSGHPDFYAQLDPLVDWPSFHAYFAAEQYIEQWDGYAQNRNNNRVYFNPANAGRLTFVPTDLDLAFSGWGGDWHWPVGRLVSACFQDATCRAAHRAAVRDVVDHLAGLDLQTDLAAWDALTLPAALADPRRGCTWVEDDRAFLSGWIDGRPAGMRAFWEL